MRKKTAYNALPEVELSALIALVLISNSRTRVSDCAIRECVSAGEILINDIHRDWDFT